MRLFFLMTILVTVMFALVILYQVNEKEKRPKDGIYKYTEKKSFSKETYTCHQPYKNGLIDGMEKCFSDNPLYLYKVIPWVNGKQEGTETGYYPSGKISYTKIYKNGLLDGLSIAYYESGKVKWKAFYKNGKGEGTDIDYYENGKISMIIPYKNGKWEGEHIDYYGNGQIKTKVFYKNGHMEGDFFYYYRNGKLSEERVYKDGESISSTQYDRNGKEVSFSLDFIGERLKDDLEDK